MEIKVYARTQEAFEGLEEHYKETQKRKHIRGLKRWRIKNKIKEDDKVLIVTYGGLINMIKQKGGRSSKIFLKTNLKNDFLNELNAFMGGRGISRQDYEVVFNE